MCEEGRTYQPTAKRPDEEMTAYTLRVMREEIRHNALREAAAALRVIGANRTPPTWSVNESMAWREAANYVEDMIEADL